ncbi:AMP-binding protein [Sphaerotilus sp.]|uniref:phenylacetate--CoA ligase family protein n=1 Tax=Sphaerotilus sp. TaxID=2093942 RepID=UPI00286E0681|nr:AMP-binding protein [Sphaerotilus sp.]
MALQQDEPWAGWIAPWTARNPWGGASSGARAAEPSVVEQRQRSLLDHAYARSAFYRQHHGVAAGDAPRAWADLPPVTKPQLMQHFDDWVTDPAITREGVQSFLADTGKIGSDFLRRYAVWTSSGTSGEPGIFLQDSAALSVYSTLLESRMDRRFATHRWWALAATGAMGPWGMRPRSALVSALDGHYAGVSFWKRQCRFNPVAGSESRAFSVTAPIGQLCDELQAWRPAFIASYPSMLVELARQQEAGRLRLMPLALWSGGEGLAASTRDWIESVFGAPVVNDYGASECLAIAFECPHGRLHLNDDWVRMEPIDAHDQPVPVGTASDSVLLTNLANRVQPLIRYRLGDSVTMHPDDCACGNHRPSFTVEGRCDDTLQFPNAAGEVVHLSPMAITTALEEGADVHRFQLRQTAPDALELRLDVSLSADPAALRAASLEALRHYFLTQGLSVRLSLSDEAPAIDPRSGKLRQVVCAL